MVKAALLLAALLTLSPALVLSFNQVEGCRYKDGMWGSEDGTKFYFCLPGTDTAIEQSCRKNTFFVNNAKVTGCIPLKMVDPNCVYQSDVEPQPCKGVNLIQPQPSSVPTNYYVCVAEGATPVKLTCPAGKAFVKQDGYLGCFEWKQWRKIRNCPE